MAARTLIERFRAARRDRTVVVLEGFHPLKHALRFGAELLQVVTSDSEELKKLTGELAPDIMDRLLGMAETVPPEVFKALAPIPPPTGVIALARRPTVSPEEVLKKEDPAPVVVLENPTQLGNLGAAVRAAAAAEAAGLIALGEHDPWHPTALRGGAGLQFALPVVQLEKLPSSDRPLVVLHPEGEPLKPGLLPPRTLLVFGSERYGVTPAFLKRADRCLRIPMRSGVSSLNLATAVAVVLYTWRLARETR